MASACGDDPVNTPADSGPADTGVVTDAGSPTDTGPRTDTGSPTDTGPRVDAGSPRLAVVAGTPLHVRRGLRPEGQSACVVTTGGRVCTSGAGCDQGTTAEEEGQCGGRFSTCLVYATPRTGAQVSLCTRACVAGVRQATGACPTG
nr:hypothetical protein [Deltaproteobacteria bacterium]